jgi:hypothetical protein
MTLDATTTDEAYLADARPPLETTSPRIFQCIETPET